MNKVAQYYRELVASLSERLRNGERDIDALVEQARERVIKTGELTRTEVDELTRAVRRDLEEFAMSYEESLKEESDSVFMRVIKESLWQELADITDKTQLVSAEKPHLTFFVGRAVDLDETSCFFGCSYGADYSHAFGWLGESGGDEALGGMAD